MSTTTDLSNFIDAWLKGKINQTSSSDQMLTISTLNDGTEAGPKNDSKIGPGWFEK